MNVNKVSGMRAFIIFWIGQIISLIGSAMTWLAFTLWVWQKTGQASSLATVSFLVFLPSILFMPIAGIFVDRWERKRTLILSNFRGATATLIVFLLYTTNQLAIWQSAVDVNAQGRVFSARQLLTQIPYLMGVVSSDWLAEVGIARLTGTQNGIHLSVTLLGAGILGAIIFLAGSFHPAIRHAE